MYKRQALSLVVIAGAELFTGNNLVMAAGIFKGTEMCIRDRDTNVLYLPFRKVLHSCNLSCIFHHRLIENMVTLIADKNWQLMEKVEVTSKKTLRDKILTYLSLQAQKNGSKYFEIPLGRIELAEYLCADRSAMTRELANMKEAGLIDYEKNTFRLLR